MLIDKEKGVDVHGGVDAETKSEKREFELVSSELVKPGSLEGLYAGQLEALRDQDGEIYDLIDKEYKRQRRTLALIAAENQCSRAVLAALGSVVQDKTTEGFVGSRYHGGCAVVDEIETAAIERAKETFGAKYANVQPHSGTAANQIVLSAVLEKGDRILSLGIDQGGHLSHGAKVSFTGKFFEVENYYVDRESFLLDYEKIREQALRFRPKLIISGATAYARTIDFSRFREIADEVGAYLLADISHISGLVIAGAHISPVNHAHFTTTSTYKPGGPRGGLILMGRDYDNPIRVGDREVGLCRHIEKMTFPGVQGTPYLNHIAAKAVFFKETMTEEYRSRQFRIIENARRLAANMAALGYDVLTGGTDNHMVLINVLNSVPGMTGVIAQQALEDCGIIVNKNRLAYDVLSASIASGVRFGTPIVTKCGMGVDEMDIISAMVDKVLRSARIVGDTEYILDEEFRERMEALVSELCGKFLIR
ncbi:MAG: serine hydroxymethyltransferase [Planctomycetota bacterium]|jgi:glycine hydroxymethyltransferase